MGYDIPADHHGPLPAKKPEPSARVTMSQAEEEAVVPEMAFAALRPMRLERIRNFDPSNIYDAYVRWTDSVAQYPITAEPFYLAMGIADECGELDSARGFDQVLKEGGDCLWYCGRYCVRVLKVPFSDLVDTVHGAFPGITANIGIICGVEKKRIRDGAGWSAEKAIQKDADAYLALINVMRWINAHLRSSGFTIVDALNANRAKLDGRAAAGTIKGDGDNR